MKNLLCLSTVICFCAFTIPSANAAAIIQGFTGGGGPFTSFGTPLPSGDTVGFRFTADESGFITALGVSNASNLNVLNGSHNVGLWRNSDQTLLGSVVVASTSPTVFTENGWFYESISPLAVTAGEQYTLGAVYAANDGDTYRSGPSSVDLMHISGTVAAFQVGGADPFVYPSSTSNGNLGRIGPNAIFEAIPEPASVTLLGVGLLGFIFIRRRRA